MPNPLMFALAFKTSGRLVLNREGRPEVFLEHEAAGNFAWDYRQAGPMRIVALAEVLSAEAQWLRVVGGEILHVFDRNAVSGGLARAACGAYFVPTIDPTPDTRGRHMKCVSCDAFLPEGARAPAGFVTPPTPDWEGEAIAARAFQYAANQFGSGDERVVRLYGELARIRDANLKLEGERRAVPREGTIAGAFADVPSPPFVPEGTER